MYTEKLAKSSGVSIASLKANLAKERRRNNRARNHVRNSQRNSPDYPIDVPLPGDEDVPTEQSVVEKNPSQTRLLYLFIHSTDAQKYMLERSEEHTSELQSRFDLVCRLLLEKK